MNYPKICVPTTFFRRSIHYVERGIRASIYKMLYLNSPRPTYVTIRFRTTTYDDVAARSDRPA